MYGFEHLNKFVHYQMIYPNVEFLKNKGMKKQWWSFKQIAGRANIKGLAKKKFID